MWLSAPGTLSENKLSLRNNLLGLISLCGQTGEAEGVWGGCFHSFI